MKRPRCCTSVASASKSALCSCLLPRIAPLAFAWLLLAALIPSLPAQPQKSEEKAPAGVLSVKGSDTMVILGQRWAEGFMKTHPQVKVQVMGGGSGTGLAALINGSTDIAQASRSMKSQEKVDFIKKFKRPVREISVALDGIAIYVHGKNPIKSITMNQLKAVYRGEIKDWKDLGGEPGGIILYGRENSSGTYAFFKEHVLANMDFAPQTQTLQGTAAVINALTQDPKGIGYGGIGYSTGVRVIPVAAEETATPIPPSLEAVAKGEYPLSRHLFFYIDSGRYEGAVQSFIEYCLSDEGQKVVSQVGYYPLTKNPPAKQEEKSGNETAPPGGNAPEKKTP